MARQALSFPALPSLPIAHGALSPNPGRPYATAWSTTEDDVVAWNGSSWRVVAWALAVALAGKANEALVINTQAGAAYTLTTAAPTQMTMMTHAVAAVLTVPPYASVPIAVGKPCTVARHGAGTLTITAGAGVTLRPTNNLTVAGRYGVATLTPIALNEWYVLGQVS